MKENKNKIIVLLFAAIFFGMSILSWIKPSKDYSITERRELEQMPEISMKNISNGNFMTDFEKYALDQFPFREEFRNIKALTSKYILRKSDNNNIYIFDEYAVKMEYPLNKDSIKYASEKFNNIYKKYLNENNNIYLSIIPDKNYFTAKDSNHLIIEYDLFFETMKNEMPYAKYIDITNLLDINDYYKTDIHWKQEEIIDVAKEISSNIGIELNNNYEVKTLTDKFYGVYFGQSALSLPGEELKYLTNETLENCIVYDYENNKNINIYDFKKASKNDPYDLFLSGPISLLKIENPNAKTNKELIVFRDSFGSSFAPLLVDGYKTITLIDIRYIQSNLLNKFVDFNNKDILFLYSTTVLNNSETFK